MRLFGWFKKRPGFDAVAFMDNITPFDYQERVALGLTARVTADDIRAAYARIRVAPKPRHQSLPYCWFCERRHYMKDGCEVQA
jgi:hypothetical protein